MLSPKSHTFVNSSYGNLPSQLRRAGSQKVLIGLDDARARGISTGDRVSVFNEHGVFEAVAEVTADTMPGVVVAPMGHWGASTPGARTVNAVNSPAFADYGCAPTFSDTLVDVERHAGYRRRSAAERTPATATFKPLSTRLRRSSSDEARSEPDVRRGPCSKT